MCEVTRESFAPNNPKLAMLDAMVRMYLKFNVVGSWEFQRTGGHLRIEIVTTNLAEHVVLGKSALVAIEAYLKEGNNTSPWLFIQHGRTGSPPTRRSLSAETLRRHLRGYGTRLNPGSVRRIVVELAEAGSYNP